VFGQLQTCQVDAIRTYGDANGDVKLTVRGPGLIWPFVTNTDVRSIQSPSASENVLFVSIEIRVNLQCRKVVGLVVPWLPISVCTWLMI